MSVCRSVSSGVGYQLPPKPCTCMYFPSWTRNCERRKYRLLVQSGTLLDLHEIYTDYLIRFTVIIWLDVRAIAIWSSVIDRAHAVTPIHPFQKVMYDTWCRTRRKFFLIFNSWVIQKEVEIEIFINNTCTSFVLLPVLTSYIPVPVLEDYCSFASGESCLGFLIVNC